MTPKIVKQKQRESDMKASPGVRPSKLLIIGAGGLGTEYSWVAEEMNRVAMNGQQGEPLWELLGYTDDDPQKKGQSIRGHVVHGSINEAALKFAGLEIGFMVSIGDNRSRERIKTEAESLGWIPKILIHPSVIVATGAEIGAGSYIAPGVVVCPGARIGRFAIINTHVSVGHDSTIEDFAQICPGARVSGGCLVGKGGFVGSNACLGPKSVVGERAIVGANSFVLRSVAPGATVIGCPAITVGRAAK